MQSEEGKVLYAKYGTTKPDEEFRTIYIKGVPTKKSIKEIVDYKEQRVREQEAQIAKVRQIEETRKLNLQRKAERERQIEECRRYNLEREAQKEQESIQQLVRKINLMSPVR